MTGKLPDSDDDDLRLDKWLWAARFFRTRGLAQAAIKGGKIEVNDERPKPARPVRIGDMLRIRRGQFESVVRVAALSRQRGPATAAAALYEETVGSIERRQALARELRLTAASAPLFAGRPSKRDRRHIVRFTRKRGD
ncbi:MAG: RNA-binding protein [Gammaproteobacteria bacterium]|nr:RNA-binding protein [Gammaproteobacteria bacterium]MCG3145581.1 Heat shock protein 15 [Gammaproteobacteria bacterium]